VDKDSKRKPASEGHSPTVKAILERFSLARDQQQS
jgi:hypothetical protein